MKSRYRFALLGLFAIIVITVGWWMAALWPLPPSTPEWVARARTACFGDTETGMPNGGGWILLVGTPISMVGALAIMLPVELREGVAWMRRTGAGRLLLATTTVVLVALASAAGVRVASAYGWTPRPQTVSYPAPRPLAQEAPGTRLINHRGDVIDIADLVGRPLVVTFAFGKCTTVCPTLVHSALAGVAEASEANAAVVVVTLDPWRDTPSRLASIAESWGLGPDDHLLGGDIAAVSEVLDAWEIARSRDERTGDIAHPTLAYVLDREGRIAYLTTGTTGQIAEALRQTVSGTHPPPHPDVAMARETGGQDRGAR